jgi:hypothetical protein
MSLFRLLSVGKSFGEAQDLKYRYRLSDQNALPKFAPAKRPISLTPAPKPQKMETGYLFKQESNGPDAEQPKGSVTEPPAYSVAPPASTVVTGVESRIETGGLSRLLKNLPWPFARRKAAVAAVQTELQLKGITVVRNDLNDADLELVPAKLPEPAAKSGVVLKKPRLAGLAWSRLTARRRETTPTE